MLSGSIPPHPTSDSSPRLLTQTPYVNKTPYSRTSIRVISLGTTNLECVCALSPVRLILELLASVAGHRVDLDPSQPAVALHERHDTEHLPQRRPLACHLETTPLTGDGKNKSSGRTLRCLVTAIWSQTTPFPSSVNHATFLAPSIAIPAVFPAPKPDPGFPAGHAVKRMPLLRQTHRDGAGAVFLCSG